MKQTAIEWLVEQIKKDPNLRLRGFDIDGIAEQAKAMEKEQHDNTWIDSRLECKGDDYIGKEKTFEQYYNETYGKSNS